MKIILLKLFVILAFAIFLYGCSESTNTNSSPKRLVYYYYSDSSAIGWDNYFVLYSYNLNTGDTKKVTNNTIVHTTGVAQNGNIVFDCGMFTEPGCWLVNSSGVAMPMPMPVSTIPSFQYILAMAPEIQLSNDGSTAVFFLIYENSNDGSVAGTRLVYFNFLTMNCTMIDLSNYLKFVFNDSAINYCDVSGHYMVLKNGNSKLWFVVSGFNKNGNNYNFIASRVCEFSNNRIYNISRVENSSLEIIGADLPNERIFVSKLNPNDTLNHSYYIFAADNNNDSIPVNIPSENFSNPEQFAKEKSEMAGWTDNGIAIYDLNTMTVSQDVISWSRIDSLYPGLTHEKNSRLSFSPDGEYITFALPSADGIYGTDLLIIKRDGTEFKRILHGTAIGIPVISDVIQ